MVRAREPIGPAAFVIVTTMAAACGCTTSALIRPDDPVFARATTRMERTITEVEATGGAPAERSLLLRRSTGTASNRLDVVERPFWPKRQPPSRTSLPCNLSLVRWISSICACDRLTAPYSSGRRYFSATRIRRYVP